MKVLFSKICISVLLLTSTLLRAQDCDNKYLSAVFQSPTYDTFARVAYTPSNEIIALGRLLDFGGAAHLAKFTGNGEPLWSYSYKIDYFNFYPPTFLSQVDLHDFILTADGGIIVAGQVIRFTGDTTYLALLAKIDKYGTVAWSKTYLRSPMRGDLSFTNLIATGDGDFIAYMACDIGKKESFNDYSYNRVIRFSASGAIKWTTRLMSGIYHAGGLGFRTKRGLVQLRNNHIVVSDIVYKSSGESASFTAKQRNLRFVSLDYETGTIRWQSSAEFNLPGNDNNFIPDINNLNEQPDGRLSLTTTLVLSGSNRQVVNILASSAGQVEKIIAYSSIDGAACRIVDVSVDKATGNKNYLLGKANTAVIASVNANGAVTEAFGYDTGNEQFTPNCFSPKGTGQILVMSNFKTKNWKLLLTDADGHVPCVDKNAEIIGTEVQLSYAKDSVLTLAYTNIEIDYADFGYPLKIQYPFPLQKTVECEQLVDCCKDVIDSINISNLSICEGSTYTLPDNSVVKDSGMYYASFKTSRGCDSIRYYRVNTQKDPAKLTLGMDTCLQGLNSFVLHATPGYEEYNWMGRLQDSADYLVGSPGIYWVRVANQCGAKTDSVQVFEECDFEVYMPNAFTPNADNLNDNFGVPPMNRNRLVDLSIYDRWGQLVFRTNEQGKGWDGRYKKQLLATGVFVYFLRMKGLSGKAITQKGTVLLIR